MKHRIFVKKNLHFGSLESTFSMESWYMRTPSQCSILVLETMQAHASPTLLDSLSKFGRHQIWLQMFELRCFPCFANWNCQQMINVVRRKPLGFAIFTIFCYRHERRHPLSSVPIDIIRYDMEIIDFFQYL